MHVGQVNGFKISKSSFLSEMYVLIKTTSTVESSFNKISRRDSYFVIKIKEGIIFWIEMFLERTKPDSICLYFNFYRFHGNWFLEVNRAWRRGNISERVTSAKYNPLYLATTGNPILLPSKNHLLQACNFFQEVLICKFF